MTGDPISEAAQRLLDLMADDRPDIQTRDRPHTVEIYDRQARTEADGHRRRTEALWRAWGWLSA